MINTIIQELATHLSVAIVPANHGGPEPSFPYGTFDILKSDFQKPHQKIRQQIGAPDDMVKVNSYYGSSMVVRLVFFNKGATGDLLDVVRELAQQSWIWLCEEGRDVCRTWNLVPSLVSKDIESQDASQTDNKHRVGFDFALKGRIKHTKTIEAITGIQTSEVS
jgi:hypothetical protein